MIELASMDVAIRSHDAGHARFITEEHRYYRCHHVYDKNTGRNCTARYVRGDKLEEAVWREVSEVLTNPEVVLQELETQAEAKSDLEEITRLEEKVASLREREKRLVRIYTLGTIDQEVIQGESEDKSQGSGLHWNNG